MHIYLASSWRNTYQPAVLAQLRAAGHEVYDFRNPSPGNIGFGWRQVDPEFNDGRPLTADRMRATLAHPIAQHGFDLDFGAMKWADAAVLLLPCGRSAHLEAGWFAGARKPVVVLAPEVPEPELMYKCFDVDETTPIFATVSEVLAFLSAVSLSPPSSVLSAALGSPEFTTCDKETHVVEWQYLEDWYQARAPDGVVEYRRWEHGRWDESDAEGCPFAVTNQEMRAPARLVPIADAEKNPATRGAIKVS